MSLMQVFLPDVAASCFCFKLLVIHIGLLVIYVCLSMEDRSLLRADLVDELPHVSALETENGVQKLRGGNCQAGDVLSVHKDTST